MQPTGYVIEYGDRLYGNSKPLKDSVEFSTDIGKDVTIIYNINDTGISCNLENKKVPYGFSIGELPSPVAMNKYVVEGWYLDQNCTNKVNTDSNTKILLNGSDSNELTLYAKWVEDSTNPNVNVTLKSNNAIYEPGSYTKYDVEVTVEATDNYDTTSNSGIDPDSYMISLNNGDSWINLKNSTNGDGTEGFILSTEDKPDKFLSPKTVDEDVGIGINSITEKELIFKISKDGIYNLKVKVKDKCNNESDVYQAENIKIDKTYPMISILANNQDVAYTGGTKYFFQDKVSVNVNANESLSSLYYSLGKR